MKSLVSLTMLLYYFHVNLGLVLFRCILIADQNVQWNHVSPDVPFNDPAIMSARMSGSSSFESSMPDRAFAMNPSALGSPQIQTGTGTTSFRPPPGLSFPSSLGPGSVASNFSNGNGNGAYQNLDTSQASGSTHGE